MTHLKTLVEGAMLGAISIGTNILTGTQNVIETVSSGEILPTIAEQASNGIEIPSADAISTTFNLITQLAILLVTIWRFIKKDRPKNTTNGTPLFKSN
jgi:hypothetical protein